VVHGLVVGWPAHHQYSDVYGLPRSLLPLIRTVDRPAPCPGAAANP
jgi:hypothetical protein